MSYQDDDYTKKLKDDVARVTAAAPAFDTKVYRVEWLTEVFEIDQYGWRAADARVYYAKAWPTRELAEEDLRRISSPSKYLHSRLISDLAPNEYHNCGVRRRENGLDPVLQCSQWGGLGSWLSGALDDPLICEEMKADIRAWFEAGEPNPEYSQQVIDDMVYAAAQALDHPSVYMGGPSQPSMRRAKMCIKAALDVASNQKAEVAK